MTNRFGGLIAVDKINLEIKGGELIGIVGPNGSGKTFQIPRPFSSASVRKNIL